MDGNDSNEVRWLCSQLVEFRTGNGRTRVAVLEEISESTAVIAVDDPLDGEVEISLLGLPDAITANVAEFTVRETDFALRLRFNAGYRWSPAAWVPAHGLDVTRKAKSTAAGATDAGR